MNAEYRMTIVNDSQPKVILSNHRPLWTDLVADTVKLLAIGLLIVAIF